VPHGVRLYSIASSRYGDFYDGQTTSLCVRRATFWCPELGAEDPAKKGLCSNFLCDLKPGESANITGPTGKILLMPEDPNAVSAFSRSSLCCSVESERESAAGGLTQGCG
jgi:ferredoxin--NADP+ reductase